MCVWGGGVWGGGGHWGGVRVWVWVGVGGGVVVFMDAVKEKVTNINLKPVSDSQFL